MHTKHLKLRVVVAGLVWSGLVRGEVGLFLLNSLTRYIFPFFPFLDQKVYVGLG